MTRFFLVFSTYFIFAFLFIFHYGSNRFDIINRSGRGDELSLRTQKILSWIFHLGFRVLGVGIFVFLVIPMMRDTPALLRNQVSIVRGTPSQITDAPFGMWYLRQQVKINGQEVEFYLFSPLSKDKSLSVEYLPLSKFGLTAKVEHQGD